MSQKDETVLWWNFNKLHRDRNEMSRGKIKRKTQREKKIKIIFLKFKEKALNLGKLLKN